MKTYKVELTEDFIKEAHAVACPDWKTKIKDLVPEAFEYKLEVRKWYKHRHNKNIFINYQGNKHAYGFGFLGEWTNSFNTMTNNYIPATPEEVEEMLTKEAKKRGLVEGIKVKSVSLNSIEEIKRNSYFLHDNCFFVNNGIYENICIMKDGVWAEPIENPTLKRIQEIEAELKQLKEKL